MKMTEDMAWMVYDFIIRWKGGEFGIMPLQKALDESFVIKNGLWKDAQGDDLPEYDKEVIVIDRRGKVSYGHRPDPEGWDGINPLTKEKEHFDVYTHGIGGWNIDGVKWWLDLPLPYEGKEGEK